MGCGQSTPAPTKGTVWAELKQRLPLDRTDVEVKKRDALFIKFDEKKNKSLSEAECLSGCKRYLELEKLTANLAPINKRAYKAASGLRTKKDATSGVDPAEFRLYLKYIRDYFELDVMFDEVDTSKDRLVTRDEFKKALPKMQKWGVHIKNPDESFRAIDKNGGGVEFDEFADWALKQNLDAEKDSSIGNLKAAPAGGIAGAATSASRDLGGAASSQADGAAEKLAAEKAAAEKEAADVKAAAEKEAADAKAAAEKEAADAKAAAEKLAAEKEAQAQKQRASGEGKARRKAMWVDIQARLPRRKTAAENAARNELFQRFDPNGNGYLSLAEVDTGARGVLDLDKFTDDLHPILSKAFHAAKDARQKRGKVSEKGSDFVERVEFRLLLVYLYDYFEMWVMFDEIDTSDDRLVSFSEFQHAVPTIESWGVAIADPEATFKSVDAGGSGSISFDEFCDWAIAQHLDADGDSDNEE